MATGPQPCATPLELLTKKHSEEEPALNKFWGAGLCGSVVFTAVCMANHFSKRPAFSGKFHNITSMLSDF